MSDKNASDNDTKVVSNFIRTIIDKDLEAQKNDGNVITRFPPEPNGYLHIGHAKSICLNFGLANSYGGRCHLRFDDTNPVAEDPEYVEAIKNDIEWLGFSWGDHLYFASDYFSKLYDFAVQLIKLEKAYVDTSSPEEIREMRGSLTEPGKNSPQRDRSVEENLQMFEDMKNGKFEDGGAVLRAKIDMSSPNMNLRDPILYRVRKVAHHRAGDEWQIYPMYDFTHPLSDMLEGITHSICTLEFEDHRPLYDWLLDTLKTPCHPQQIEFAKLMLDYTIMGKRKLLQLVNEKKVSGWDDPRMPTIMGMRRRGFRPEAIRNFAEKVGVTKKNSMSELGYLEHAVREDLDEIAPRAFGVLDPIKLVIENYPEGQSEELEGPVHPKKPELGVRKIPLSREVYIDRDDFMEEAPKKYFRLKPDGKVRLKYAFVVHCHEVIKDGSGKVTELRCTYDDRTRNGVTPEGEKKVKGIIHWVAKDTAVPATVRLYDRMVSVSNPSSEKDKDFMELLNPDSLVEMSNAMVEPSIRDLKAEEHVQFERLGFFVADRVLHKTDQFVLNRTVTLKDTWQKVQKK